MKKEDWGRCARPWISAAVYGCMALLLFMAAGQCCLWLLCCCLWQQCGAVYGSHAAGYGCSAQLR
eukprot:695083-Rhodomonas_salina.1